MEGWIKLHRKLTEKSFYRKDSEAVHLWIHILICANRMKREEVLGGKMIICEPGQFTTGRKQLSESTGINESKIERLLNKFEKIEQQIEQQKTNTNRLISVLNWIEYQLNDTTTEQQLNNDRTTTEQQLNTLQEVKTIKTVKNKETDFLAKIISEFQTAYFETFQSEYVVMNIGKERAAAGKILKLYKTKFPDHKSEETAAGLKLFFEKCCTVPDDWLQKNMSLSIIVSKFNEISKLIKNGTQKIKRVTSAESLENLTKLATAVGERYSE